MTRETISAGLYLALCLLTVFDALAGSDAAVWAASGMILVYLLLETHRTAATQRYVGLALAALGLAAAALNGSLVDTLLDGLRRTLPFLLLFASVTWLQIPAGQSPALLKVRAVALAQPPGRRFAVVGVVSHFLGVAFNLAGLSLLSPMVRQGTAKALRERLGRAMVQGFGAGTAWSPFYVGTAVILSTVPGVRWLEVAPVGLVLAVVTIACSWGYDRVFLRGAGPATTKTDTNAPTLTGGDLRAIATILGLLFSVTILLVEGFKLSIPVSLAIVAPLFACAWALVIRRRTPSATAGSALIQTVFAKMPDLRGETLLFAGANILGVGISTLLSPAAVEQTLASIDPTPALSILLLMGGMVLTSMVGLHPVVFVVLVTSVLSPEKLGITPQVAALAMMCMWGQSTNSSPFSATALFMSRVTGDSNWTIAWRWNAPFALMTTVILAGVLIAVDALGLY